MFNLWSYIVQAGWIGYILTFVSIISLGVIIERVLYWYGEMKCLSLDQQDNIIDGFVQKKQAVIKTAIADLKGVDYEAIEYISGSLDRDDDKALDVAMSRVVTSTNRCLGILEVNGVIAPMFGILGTTTGVIESFQGMSGGMPDTGAMVAGISVSMLTTAIGLVVALMSIIPHNYFVNKAYKKQVAVSEFLQECWMAKSATSVTSNQSAVSKEQLSVTSNQSADEKDQSPITNNQ